MLDAEGSGAPVNSLDFAGAKAGLADFQRAPNAFYDELDQRLGQRLEKDAQPPIGDQGEPLHDALRRILDEVEFASCGKRAPKGKRLGAGMLALLSLMRRPSVAKWTTKELSRAASVSEPTFIGLRRRLSREIGLPIPCGHTSEQRAKIGSRIADMHRRHRRQVNEEIAA